VSFVQGETQQGDFLPACSRAAGNAG
jgi:hypothetical protein